MKTKKKDSPRQSYNNDTNNDTNNYINHLYSSPDTNKELEFLNHSHKLHPRHNNNNTIDTDSDNDETSGLILGQPVTEIKSLLSGPISLQKTLYQAKHPWHDKKLTALNHLSIGSYWFGWAFLWLPLTVLIIPSQISIITSDESKGKIMGQVFLFGSIGSLIFSPLFGHLSDYSQNKIGRRKPFLIWGIMFTTFGLFIMSFSPPIIIYSLGFFIATCGNYITLAPYSALVPDVVPYNQRGICSGYLGACSIFGYMLGAAISYNLENLGYFLTFLFLICIHFIFGFITVKYVPEIRYVPKIKNVNNYYILKNLFNGLPFSKSDFTWVFISRFFIQMGSIIVQENLQYYIKDTKNNNYNVLGTILATNEVQATSVLFAPLLFGGFFSSIISGLISDYYGQERKFLVYLSGILMSLSCILFGINSYNLFYFTFDIIISLIFGFGFGIFSAIDWAMATDVLPNPISFGRDMGLWNLAFTLPQIICSPIVGYFVDMFRNMKYLNFGWFIISIFSSINFAIGTMIVRKIKHVK